MECRGKIKKGGDISQTVYKMLKNRINAIKKCI